MNGIFLALIIIVIYIFIAVIVRSRYSEQLNRYSLGFYGPLLLWRTTRGKSTIDKLARFKRFWKVYSTISIGVVFIIMFLMLGMIIISAYAATLSTAEPLPPQNVLVLPGLNPIIPLWFGLIALIIAVVIHEFAHGILARVADIKIKSLGVVMFVIPVGAFVEPDEEKLRSTTKLQRNRVFAAGPATNIFVGILCGLIFAWGFMGSLQPVEDGVLIFDVTEEYPADDAGILPGMIITHVEGFNATGMNLGSIQVNNKQDFNDFMENTAANDTINLTVFDDGDMVVLRNITLVDKGEYYPEMEEFDGKGFLGIRSMGTDEFTDRLSHPVRSADSREEAVQNVVYVSLFLPLDTKILPFHEPITDVYEPEGALGGMPESGFWFTANLLYYLFWLNILLGVFNALPAVPLDGGYSYRDAWDTMIKKLKPHLDDEQRENAVNGITVYTALFIFFIFVWILIVPYF
jgi:membrane-associated protease RseP (regulator of RpoE activity)